MQSGKFSSFSTVGAGRSTSTPRSYYQQQQQPTFHSSYISTTEPSTPKYVYNSLSLRSVTPNRLAKPTTNGTHSSMLGKSPTTTTTTTTPPYATYISSHGNYNHNYHNYNSPSHSHQQQSFTTNTTSNMSSTAYTTTTTTPTNISTPTKRSQTPTTSVIQTRTTTPYSPTRRNSTSEPPSSLNIRGPSKANTMTPALSTDNVRLRGSTIATTSNRQLNTLFNKERLASAKLGSLPDLNASINSDSGDKEKEKESRMLSRQGSSSSLMNTSLGLRSCSRKDSSSSTSSVMSDVTYAATPVLNSRRSMRMEGKNKGLVGLQNLGNTCFMNSCLQCLNKIPPLLNFFVGQTYRKFVNERSPKKGLLAKEFAELMIEMWEGSEGASVCPSNFRDAVKHYAPQFASFRQQDSQEFLRFLLDGLHEDMNMILQPPAYEELKDIAGEDDLNKSRRWWKHYTLRNSSVVTELFAGQLKSCVECTACKNTSIAFDPFWDLSIPIPERSALANLMRLSPYQKDVTLDECLQKFTEEEHLTGNEQFYCSRCKKHTDSIKKLSIFKFPKVLVLHMKRFSYTSAWKDKITTNVTFPLNDFNLSACKDRHSSEINVSYDLYGIINHMGEMNWGHYTSYCRQNDQWQLYNDSSVSSVSTSKLTSPSAYVLLYLRKD